MMELTGICRSFLLLSPAVGRWAPALVSAAVAGLVSGCDVPHDAGDTLQEVRGGTLRAGAVEAPPWVVSQDPDIGGIEVELARHFAEEVGAADIEWITGPESTLLTALHRRELDLVIGGLRADSPWKGRIGLSQAYLEAEVDIGVPPGLQGLPDSWAGERIGYPAGEPELAALIREREAIPVALDEPAAMPMVAPRWLLAAWGLTPIGEELEERQHVMAVPPGESGMLFRLDRFLAGREDEVRRRLEGRSLGPPQ